jgi:hypothetical protein
MTPSSSHFPNIDRLELVVRAWPKLFAQHPGSTQPLHLEQSTLFVLCQSEELAAQLASESEEIVDRLNRGLDGDVTITGVEMVPATRTEIFLAREILMLKLWLRDFDIGF